MSVHYPTSSACPPLESAPARRVPLGLLLLVAFSGTLAMHMFVPALPLAERDLATTSQTIQLTITIYILGLAIGQLVYGPVSDALGRRPAVFTGLVIYFVGCVAAHFAPDAATLLAARFVQSLGGAAGLALTRAIVGDMAAPGEATRKLAMLNLVLLIGPGLAPIAGGLIAEALGWRAIFTVLAMMSATTILLSLKWLPETATPTGQLNVRAVRQTFATLFRNRTFMALAIGGSFGSTGSYAYFVAAPFILHVEMGMDLALVGYCVGGTLVAASLGTLSARFLVRRVGTRVILTVFSSCAFVVAALFLTGAVTGWLTPVTVVAFSFALLFCGGGMSPTALGLALESARHVNGSAAGVYGFFQMTVGVLCTWLSGLGSVHAIACGLVLVLAYGIAFTLLTFKVR